LRDILFICLCHEVTLTIKSCNHMPYIGLYAITFTFLLLHPITQTTIVMGTARYLH
jgi:hypothetical protein